MPLAESHSAASDPSASASVDLISFLKAIPDHRSRRGRRYPQWFLLLVAVLGILRGCRSSIDLVQFASEHRHALNQALDLDLETSPSQLTFLNLFNMDHLQNFDQVLRAWLISQIPDGAEGLDQLVRDGNVLSDSVVQNSRRSNRFIAQVTAYVKALDVAITQKTCDTRESSERVALRELLVTFDAEQSFSGSDNLISFLKAIPDGRSRGGRRYPQWWMLLVAILGILSGCRNSRALVKFVRGHKHALSKALRPYYYEPSNATFLNLFNMDHLQNFDQILRAWLISQIPGGAEGLDQLVRDGNVLSDSVVQNSRRSNRFIAQVTAYVKALDVAITQKTCDTRESSERVALRELLVTLAVDRSVAASDQRVLAEVELRSL